MIARYDDITENVIGSHPASYLGVMLFYWSFAVIIVVRLNVSFGVHPPLF